MRTTSFLLAVSVAFGLAACDNSSGTAPEEVFRLFHDGVEVESIEDIPEPMQELVYETWDMQEEALGNPDLTFRASCVANCEHGKVYGTGDSCSCDDAVGCSSTIGNSTVTAPCPTRTHVGRGSGNDSGAEE